MVDIQEMILSKYDVDIVNENIFKLYKINSINIDAHELETKISETRKRWNISVNGANERIANRDRLRLEKAEKYEAILRDEKLRKKVFDYSKECYFYLESLILFFLYYNIIQHLKYKFYFLFHYKI